MRLLLTATEPLALPGVATRQIALASMPSREAARLFKALAPRPITRGELGCDNPAELKRELQRLIGELGPRLAGLDDFQVRNVADQPLRVQWRLPSLASAAALQRELNGVSTLLQLDLPPVSASGHAALLGCLSLPRMLARHPALLALHGNPKAISLAVSLLLPDAVTPRPLSDVGTLIERQRSNSSTSSADADAEPPLADSCRQVLEQLQEILSPPSPTKSPAAEKSPPATPTAAGGGPAVRGADDGTDDADPARATFSSVNEPVALAGEKSREKMPASLMLRREEYMRMMSGASWLGSGSLGAVYDVDLGGTRVAVKKFFESACSSRAFQREAVLLAELRHPNIVQLIKVSCRAPLCIVTELVTHAASPTLDACPLLAVLLTRPLRSSPRVPQLVCSLHAMLHHGAGGALRPHLLEPGLQQLKTCMHIARGMNYLHNLDPPVLHRNLKSQVWTRCHPPLTL